MLCTRTHKYIHTHTQNPEWRGREEKKQDKYCMEGGDEERLILKYKGSKMNKAFLKGYCNKCKMQFDFKIKTTGPLCCVSTLGFGDR